MAFAVLGTKHKARAVPRLRYILSPMPTPTLPVLEFVANNYRNFNARATRDALYSYWDHVVAAARCTGRWLVP
jgi:hypothetical protein